MRRIPKRLFSVMAVAALAGQAQAEPPKCAERQHLVTHLAQKYGETFSGGGMVNEDKVYEVWSSRAKGTWTILVTTPNGVSCVMASGTDWVPPTADDKKPGIPG